MDRNKKKLKEENKKEIELLLVWMREQNRKGKKNGGKSFNWPTKILFSPFMEEKME